MLFRGLFWIVMAALLSAGVPVWGETGSFELSRFIEPGTCGDCHSEIYSQWQHSMHNLSQKDPVYRSVAEYIRNGLKDQNEIAEAESCVKCHVPVGVATGYPQKVSDDPAKIPAIADQGIQCDYCHSAVSVKKMYNNGLALSPGNGEEDPGVKRGPFDDSESDFHETAFSELHTRSEICGTCHNVKHVAYLTDLETTYEEWKNSPYNQKEPQKRVTCQGCHMYQRPGIPATGATVRPKNKGTAVDDGPVREHIFTHYFVGANPAIPRQFGDTVKPRMAEDRLKNAAALKLDTAKVSEGKLGIVVTNIGAGHKLPTGLTDTRQMWLEIVITDPATGKPVLVSGKLDPNRYLPEDARVYRTVFGDGHGRPVWNIAKAREILQDKRILPRQSITESIPLPKGPYRELAVQVKLQYRSAPQKVVDKVAGKGKLVLPVITMAELEEKIVLTKPSS